MIGTGVQTQTIVAGMGELKVITCSPGDQRFLKTTVGSCVGLFLVDSTTRTFGVAHIMLPSPLKDDGALGKYADTAVPELLRLMGAEGRGSALKGYVVGGASMFGSGTRSFVADIGRRNVEATLSMTSQYNIPIVHEETGGNQGRTAILDCRGATVTVKTLRNPGFTIGDSSGD